MREKVLLPAAMQRFKINFAEIGLRVGPARAGWTPRGPARPTLYTDEELPNTQIGTIFRTMSLKSKGTRHATETAAAAAAAAALESQHSKRGGGQGTKQKKSLLAATVEDMSDSTPPGTPAKRKASKNEKRREAEKEKERENANDKSAKKAKQRAPSERTQSDGSDNNGDDAEEVLNF